MGSNQLLCPSMTTMTQKRSKPLTEKHFLGNITSRNQHKFRAEVLYTLEKEEEEEEYIYKEASTDDTYVPYEDYYTE